MMQLETRVERLEARVGRPGPNWPTARPGIGTPIRVRAACRPGNAARIPGRGRPSGPPRATGGSGRTSPAAGPARRGPAPAGSSSGSRHGTMKLGCLIAPTAADIRDVMVEGPSGLLAVAPPWCRPRFEPSKRRVTWPNGAAPSA